MTIRARKEYNLYMKKKILNKILDSKISKKVMIPVGNKIIKGIKYIGGQVEKDIKSREYQSEKLRKENEMERTGQVAMKKKGRITSDGYMRG